MNGQIVDKTGDVQSMLGVLETGARAGNIELLLLLALLCSMVAVVLAMLALRKIADIAKGNEGFDRMNQAVQELKLRLNDLYGRWSTDVTKLTEDVEHLKERLKRIEDGASKLGIGPRTSPEHAVAEVEETFPSLTDLPPRATREKKTGI